MSGTREHAAGDPKMDALRKALEGLDELLPEEAAGRIADARQALDAMGSTADRAEETFADLMDQAAAAAPGTGRQDALARIRRRIAALEERSRWPAPSNLMARQSDPRPDPLLRGTGCGGSVLSRGEVLVLAGAGGRGKSTLALQWAMAMAIADACGQNWIRTGGLDCRAGRTLVLSYEDAGRRVADRATAASNLRELGEHLGPAPETSLPSALDGRLRFMEMRGYPLFGVGEGQHRMNRPGSLPAWRHVWGFAGDADMMVIDPALSAYVADQNDAAFVRLFLDELFAEAARRGCGVLLIAHSSKEGRRSGGAEGSVSGSAAWHDAARAVLALEQPGQAGADTLQLSVVKANYSPRFQRRLARRVERSGKYDRMLGFEDAGKWESGEKPGKRIRTGKERNAEKAAIEAVI